MKLKVSKTNLIVDEDLNKDVILARIIVDSFFTDKLKKPKNAKVYYTICNSGDLITIENEDSDTMESITGIKRMSVVRARRNLDCLMDKNFKKGVENRIKILLGDL